MASSGLRKMGAEVGFSAGDVGESGAQTTAVKSKLIDTSGIVWSAKQFRAKHLISFFVRL